MDAKKTYFGLAIDPLHIGAGGYRLGRVDNTIVRDPGTDLPKAPGSSISGVCRNYAIYRLDDEDRAMAENCARHQDPRVRNNCGKCAVCNVFGFASGERRSSSDGPANKVGLVKFFDAGIVAFPVSTMCGPVWITTAGILGGLGVKNAQDPPQDSLFVSFDVPGNHINLGWLYLPTEKKDFSLPDSVGNEISQNCKNLAIVHPFLFSEVVNSNLEVRTSVAIDFNTGAAQKGNLFTYEAIPRATLLAFDIVIDEYRCTESYPAERVRSIVEAGLEMFEVMGLGGMNTRGFGRMKVANLEGGRK